MPRHRYSVQVVGDCASVHIGRHGDFSDFVEVFRYLVESEVEHVDAVSFDRKWAAVATAARDMLFDAFQ